MTKYVDINSRIQESANKTTNLVINLVDCSQSLVQILKWKFVRKMTSGQLIICSLMHLFRYWVLLEQSECFTLQP